MTLNEILYATQYYRAPTPLAEEWETDISKLGDIAIDTFQIRINWRWNERKEDEYDFSDVDRLMELAAKYNKKVIIKTENIYFIVLYPLLHFILDDR